MISNLTHPSPHLETPAHQSQAPPDLHREEEELNNSFRTLLFFEKTYFSKPQWFNSVSSEQVLLFFGIRPAHKKKHA